MNPDDNLTLPLNFFRMRLVNGTARSVMTTRMPIVRVTLATPTHKSLLRIRYQI